MERPLLSFRSSRMHSGLGVIKVIKIGDGLRQLSGKDIHTRNDALPPLFNFACWELCRDLE